MARKETIEQAINRLEKQRIALDREIFDINMLVAARRVPFSHYPRWAEAYAELDEVENELSHLRALDVLRTQKAQK